MNIMSQMHAHILTPEMLEICETNMPPGPAKGALYQFFKYSLQIIEGKENRAE